MAPQFSLATLLRLREIAAQREERLLGQILQQIVHGQQMLADLGAQRRSLTIQHQGALEKSMSAMEIIDFYRTMKSIEDLENTGNEQLNKLAKLRDQQLKIYEAAHQAKELLCTMRAEQREEYQREQIRQEQKGMDDIFASRRDLH